MTSKIRLVVRETITSGTSDDVGEIREITEIEAPAALTDLTRARLRRQLMRMIGKNVDQLLNGLVGDFTVVSMS